MVVRNYCRTALTGIAMAFIGALAIILTLTILGACLLAAKLADGENMIAAKIANVMKRMIVPPLSIF